MNKCCPKCRKQVSKRNPHIFVKGKRYHKACKETLLEEQPPILPDSTVELSEKDIFVELWKKGLEYNRLGYSQWRFQFCQKRGLMVYFTSLKEFECWKCVHYIGNKGDCDCL